jgi:hypothetical protein
MLFKVTKSWSQHESQEERHCHSHLYSIYFVTRVEIVSFGVDFGDSSQLVHPRLVISDPSMKKVTPVEMTFVYFIPARTLRRISNAVHEGQYDV